MPLYYGGTPDIQATLFLGAPTNAEIDLAPYITGVSINKDVAQPAGVWQLNLVTDFIQQGSNGALNPKDLTPFDYLEIKVRSDPGLARPFYYMRGFVDNVSVATDAGGAGGRMSRSASISGRDYGGLLQNYQIYAATTDQQAKSFIFDNLLSQLGTDGGGGKDGKGGAITVSEFGYRVIHNILNDMYITGKKQPQGIAKFQGLNVQQPKIREVLTTVNIPSSLGANISPSGLMTFSGTLDELLRQVESPPWGEYFIRDDPDGPRVYFRIAPFLDRNGKFANSWVKENKAHPYNDSIELVWVGIRPEDILNTNLTKSQNESYTFFLSAVQGGPIQGDIIQAVLSGEFRDAHNIENINPYFDALAVGDPYAQKRSARFGFRPLEVQSPWVAGDYTKRGSFTQASDDPATWKEMKRMNQWLVDTMGRMETLESGTITCRGIMGTRRGGTEIAARVGDYIYLQKSPKEAPYYYYVQSLDISWVEGAPMTETFQVIRGEQLTNTENPSQVDYQPHTFTDK